VLAGSRQKAAVLTAPRHQSRPTIDWSASRAAAFGSGRVVVEAYRTAQDLYAAPLARPVVLRHTNQSAFDGQILASDNLGVRDCVAAFLEKKPRFGERATEDDPHEMSAPTNASVDKVLETADVGKTQIAGAGGVARLQGINNLILKS
jgi:hypothetical protein